MKLARWGAALLLLNFALTGCDLFGAATPTPPPAAPSPAPGPSPTTAPASATQTQPVSGSLGSANLQHLNFLVEDVTIAGKPMAITH
ncbi:MAG TPA: hypothetical protein VFM49_07585, partial [Chloroflexia bacterium]|nr:hypothetical protein [Chloroflexia bacterium]